MEEIGRGTSESLWWRDLKRALHHSQQGQVIQNGLKWKVGGGDKIRFWEDRWISMGESLAEKYPRLYTVSSQQNQLIRQMGSFRENGWEWNFIWRRPLFEPEIDSAVSFLREVDDNLIQQQDPDGWEWVGDLSGIYSTHSAYNMLREELADGIQEECFEELWKIKVPSKIAVFAWRLFKDRLPTKKNLQRRQIQIVDSLCPFCKRVEEDASHLFIHCIKIQPIWWDSMSWMNIKGAFPLKPKHHFLQHSFIQIGGIRVKRWQGWWLAVNWSIWQMRNKILFSNETFNGNKLFEDAVFLLWTWIKSVEKDFSIHFNHWSSNLRQSFLQ
ncbi:hypothetical protein JHK87_023106 [Glycine soja]|nr:hypothetical protein JHK87_023106 [Glycine soja]